MTIGKGSKVPVETRRPTVEMRFFRALWVLVAVVALGIFIASIPGYFLLISQGSLDDRFISAPSTWERVLNLLPALLSSLTALLSLSLAMLLYRRGATDRMALFVSYFLLLYGVTMAGPIEALEPFLPGIATINSFVLMPVILIPFTMILFAIFPDGRFVIPWTRWIVVLSIILTPLNTFAYPVFLTRSFTFTNWLFIGGLYLALFIVGFSVVYAQIHRYRFVSTLEQRQQIKWVIYGIALWFGLMGISTVPYLYLQSIPESSLLPGWASWLSLIWMLSVAILPVSLSISVLRYRLYEIDILINRTLVYTLLTAALVLVYLISVGSIQGLIRALTGHTSQFGVVLSTLIIAALFNPLRRRTQRAIDRRFYRHRFDSEQIMADFGGMIRNEVDLDRLTGELVHVVSETLQPERVSLWLSAAPDQQPDSLRRSANM